MGNQDLARRHFLKTVGMGSAAWAMSDGIGAAEAAAGGTPVIAVDPAPLFDLSPYLYMQFMEPLGTTDASLDAAWDFAADRWREDLVEITQILSPASTPASLPHLVKEMVG